MENVKVSIELLSEDAKMPKYANPFDSGMDIYVSEEIIIKPRETVLVKTGLKFAIPEGYELQIRPRSGISLNTPLRIPNSPGTIDSGYRDELCIIVQNTSETMSEEIHTIRDKGNKKGIYKILKGDKICQMVLSKVPRMDLEIVDSVKEIGNDRKGGFGSSGHS
jgi:dUTP pyrophosphatase